MSWLSNLFTSSDKKVERTFMSGMDYFSSKEYSMAYKSFLKAFKMTKSKKIRYNCLINASSAMDSLNNKNEASNLLIEAAKLKANMNDSVREITEILDKAYAMVSKDNPDDHGQLIGPLMIFKIANQDFSFIKRLNKRLQDGNVKDSFNTFALEVYKNLIKEPESIWDQDNFIDFPQNFPNEFKNYVKTIQSVIRNSVALTSSLNANTTQLKAGEILDISFTIKNYTPLTITKVYLNSGAKGTIASDSKEKFPKNISSKQEEFTLDYQLSAQLTGQWNVGPLAISYMIGGDEYNYTTDNLVVEVLEGEKSIELNMQKVEEIEEDFEYEIKGEIVNNGNTILENLKLQVKVPKEGKITLGTPEKTIFELRKGESFSFSNNIRFDVGVLGKQFKVKVKVSYEGGETEQDLIISGSM